VSGPGVIHKDPHPLRHRRVDVEGQAGSFAVLDWFDRETGQTWNDLRDYNRLATNYSGRRRMKKLPKDNEVVVLYTAMGGTFAAHASEIREVPDGEGKEELF
jgi:hypothetical protein